MPDERGYYTSAEKSAYEPGRCRACGSVKRVKWYPHKALNDQTNSADLWSPSPEMCLTPEKH